ncbi:MAG: HAMP domain-containing sensor histidine kinase [Pseudomonadota bacterium]|nr:HAMP domain-containing sensor histidine kinase [Pseudomonadota bacterium]
MRLPRLLNSATFRLALIYMLLFGGSVGILLAFLYWATAGVLSDQVDETIKADIKGLAEQYERRGTTGVAAIISERVRRDPGGRTVYLLADAMLRPVVGNLSGWPKVSPRRDGWIIFELLDRETTDGSTHLARARHFVLSGGSNLLVGREVRELERTRQMIINAMIWGTVITLALAFAGGLAMSRSTARKIETINQTSRDIMDGNLDRRIPNNGSNDEFDHLAGNLNAMLDRNQALMEGLRHVSDNIAHDLRTPLTRLRGNLEDIDGTGLSGDERKQKIETAILEADGLLSVFNALLRISQIEAGGRQENFAPVNLAKVASDVVELYEPLAEEKEIVFTGSYGPGDDVIGDRDLLFQAIANLADNAIKFTPNRGKVVIKTLGNSVTVTDTGIGIPEDARDDVFRRFYQLETSRNPAGSGLGLSLVEAVAILHKGNIRLEDNHPGLKAILSIT